MGLLKGCIVISFVLGLAVIGFRIYYVARDRGEKEETKEIREEVDLDESLSPSSSRSTESKEGNRETEEKRSPSSDFSEIGKRKSSELIRRLREKYSNDDVIGYIVLDGYDIEYPVMYGDTNDSYIKSSPYGGYDYNGSIFLDSDNHSDFSDSRSVIYGHNMIDGSMFGSLNDNYLEDIDGKTFTIYSENGIGVYEIFSSEMVNAYEDNYCLYPGMKYEKELREKGYTEDEVALALSVDYGMEDFYNKIKVNNMAYSEEVVLADDSKIVTLMTCYADGHTHRLGVSGVLIDEDLS